MEVAWSCVPPGEGSSSYYRNTFKIRRQEKERETPGAMKTSSRSEQRKKIKNSVNKNQENYNAKMKKARGKPSLFRVDEIVAIKTRL